MRAFGYNKNLNQRKIPGEYDVDTFGLNYRMGEINASLGCIQLLDLKKFLSIRKKNFLKIFNSFKNFKSFKILKHLQNDNFQSSYYCISLI